MNQKEVYKILDEFSGKQNNLAKVIQVFLKCDLALLKCSQDNAHKRNQNQNISLQKINKKKEERRHKKSSQNLVLYV